MCTQIQARNTRCPGKIVKYDSSNLIDVGSTARGVSCTVARLDLDRIIAVLYCNARPCNICNSGGPMVASTLIELDTSGFSRVDHCCWAKVCIGNLEKASDNENRRKRLRSYSVHGSNLSTSQASYRKPMRALASHLRHVCKVRARLQGNTVVLVRNADVANSHIFAQANIEAIGIFSSCISSRCSI